MPRNWRPLAAHLRKPLRVGIVIGFGAGLLLLGSGIAFRTTAAVILGVAMLVVSAFNTWTYRQRTRQPDSN